MATETMAMRVFDLFVIAILVIRGRQRKQDEKNERDRIEYSEAEGRALKVWFSYKFHNLPTEEMSACVDRERS
jgi:hypothetical protein